MMEGLKKITRPIHSPLMEFFSFLGEFPKHYRSQQLSPIQKQFLKELSFFKPHVPKEEERGILLVQYLQDYEYTIKFAAATKTYAEENKLRACFYDVNWMRWLGFGNKTERFFNKHFKSATLKIHQAFGNNVLFKAEDKFHNQVLIREQLEKIMREIKTPEDLLKLKFDDVLVGDLVYDTYLRYFNEPTIKLNDPNLVKVMEVALNIFYGFSAMLKKYNVKTLFNSYNTYIEHGIPARLCLAKKIKVLTFGSYSYIVQEATTEFPFHTINHTLFDPNKKIDPKNLELAKQNFTSRFTGAIDEATRYMKTSAFSEKPINEDLKNLFGSSKRNVVIYTHDFYDSPHVNRCLQFPDLYQFLVQTLEAIKATSDTNFYIKTHPNSYGDSRERTIAMVKAYGLKNFHILDDSVSNLHIIQLKPDLIVTARGTVGVEMAWFKIPVVALYDNIYINFNFVHSCRDLDTFYDIVRGKRLPVNDFDPDKICSFYFQAYMEKISGGKDNPIFKLTTTDGANNTDSYLKNILDKGFPKWKHELLTLFAIALKQQKK
jgi:hypothetical protein